MSEEWCPTMQGSYSAYGAEYLSPDGEWERLPTVRASSGVPQPMYNGGINQTLCLMGYEQALALAWTWAAIAEAEGRGCKIRLVTYRVVFDLKAKKDGYVELNPDAPEPPP